MKGQGKPMIIKFEDKSDLVNVIDGITALTQIISNEQMTETRSKGYLINDSLMLVADLLENVSRHISGEGLE